MHLLRINQRAFHLTFWRHDSPADRRRAESLGVFESDDPHHQTLPASRRHPAPLVQGQKHNVRPINSPVGLIHGPGLALRLSEMERLA